MGGVAIRQGSSGTSSRGLHVAVGNLQEYCNGIFLVERFECSCLVFLDLFLVLLGKSTSDAEALSLFFLLLL